MVLNCCYGYIVNLDIADKFCLAMPLLRLLKLLYVLYAVVIIVVDRNLELGIRLLPVL